VSNTSEAKAAYSGPAMMTDRFFIAAKPDGVRIAFLEEGLPGLVPQLRVAVAMNHADALALADQIIGLLRPSPGQTN
jgi:hypothetical protein